MADGDDRGAGAPETTVGVAEAVTEPGAAAQGVGARSLTPETDPDAATAGAVRADVGQGLGVLLAKAVPLQPRWLRPAIVFTVALAHAGTLTALTYVHSQSPPAVETIEATVVAAGDEAPIDSSAARAPEPASDAAPEAKPTPSVEQVEAPPAPVAADEPPEPASPVAAATPPPAPADQPPPVETPPQPPPKAPPPPSAAEAAAPPPSPPRVEKPTRPKPEARPALERPKPPKPAAPKVSASRSDSAANRPEASEAHRVGTASGQPVDSGASRASYAALVVAEIQAHRYYPASARERGEQGAVGVAFTIGSGGRVASASIVRPSGFAELDEAARQIVRSISPPPPPGGSFAASTTIRFHFE